MFTFNTTNINDVIIIETHQFNDERGLYNKIYEETIFAENGIKSKFTESSDIYSKKGVLRGLHYQNNYSQAKLIHVLKGVLFDVALDLRRESITFGKFFATKLIDKEHKSIYIPEGFAHGFISLSDETIFSYMCSGKYDPSSCGGIIWNDKELNIPWPLEEYEIEEIIATNKDKNWPTFSEYKKKVK